ncbi:MAG: hypothetical protein NW206_20350 [Hyphomonadaceae bacterium]|nr:hypothetical protein [Hyphomonadaceae bacterium]
MSTETIEAPKKNAAWKSYAIGFLFWLPLLSGVVSRFKKSSQWFGDYGAVACAAEKWLQGGQIYNRELDCPNVHEVVYVYHPAIAQVFSYPLSVLGQQGMFWAYAALFALSVTALIWLMIGRGAKKTRKRSSRFAAFMTGSAIYWGNIAVIFHALIGVVAVGLRKRPSLLVLAIALAALVKPLFLTFAAVFVLAPWPFWRRALYTLAVVVLGAAPSLYFLQYGGELATQWRDLISYFVYVDRPGAAFFGWLDLIGQPIDTPAAAIAYLGFAAIMCVAGLIIVEGLNLDGEARTLLGLSLGIILIPRLMSQDFWLLGPGLATLAVALLDRHARAGKAFSLALLSICVFALLANMADFADLGVPLAVFALALTFIAAAGFVLTQSSLGAILGSFWRGAPTEASPHASA